MSGMHMLPIYYTTTNQRKRKKGKKSQRLLQAEIEHEKYLRKMGYDPNVKRKPAPLKPERVAKPLPDDVPISEMDWSPCLKGKKAQISGNYVVGQAYNKGNLVVLSKAEQSDENTGKRR